MVAFIRTVPMAYVNAVIANENSHFGLESPRFLGWERLPLEKLHNLVRTLKNRHARFHRPVQRRAELLGGPY
jgi:hypothetical protein